ncbi:MAG: hypothetical protein HN417_12455, partial [Desulfobacula sp.]|nr:hypothetical protein [Desulfobacula sp.]
MNKNNYFFSVSTLLLILILNLSAPYLSGYISDGLASMDVPDGTIIAYATEAGLEVKKKT